MPPTIVVISVLGTSGSVISMMPPTEVPPAAFSDTVRRWPGVMTGGSATSVIDTVMVAVSVSLPSSGSVTLTTSECTDLDAGSWFWGVCT